MNNKTADLIINLIEERYRSDADFERKMNLKPKTVNNWKRGISESYYKMLPEISIALDVTPNYLLGFDGGEISLEETELISSYRRLSELSDADRRIVLATIKNIIELKVK